MSTTFNGNPGGGGLTSPVPGRHVIPATTAPTDGDAATAASVQTAIETDIDWAAYFQLGGAWRDALGGGATSFDGPSNPAAWNDMLTTVGAPVSGLDVLPTFAAATGFSVTVGAGSGHLFTSVGIHPGESSYREIWWASQNVTHANPDATNPRIDAITVTPAAFGTASAIAVVTGTPAAVPMPPALPAGSGALFYVRVPAAAADATAFRACRGLWRRSPYPFSGMSGVISGAELSWDYTTSPGVSPLYFGAPDVVSGFSIHRLLIDGEPIEWAGYAVGGGAGIVSDSTADPFGTAASSSFDRPYYIYACGGRHNPLPSGPASGLPVLNPVTICESTVPPNPRTGKPTANLTVNGVTVIPDGAVYIGLGFVAAGSSGRRACVMDGEMTLSLNPLQQITHSFTTAGREDLGTFAGGCQPAISTKMAINCLAQGSGISALTLWGVFLQDFPLQTAPYVSLVSGVSAYTTATDAFFGGAISFTSRTGAELWGQCGPASGTTYGNLIVGAMGFNHRVRRSAGF